MNNDFLSLLQYTVEATTVLQIPQQTEYEVRSYEPVYTPTVIIINKENY